MIFGRMKLLNVRRRSREKLQTLTPSMPALMSSLLFGSKDRQSTERWPEGTACCRLKSLSYTCTVMSSAAAKYSRIAGT